ncbi:hypothetical protein LR68_04474 [Anoxybacillus sp. BCO1]|nr:hypothetical protein LR68_04474 [Anoxybacillus sp. BCO1]
MKRLKITNDHGWTPRKLRKQERKIKDASLRVRVTAVRLVMEGFLGKDVAKMVNLCRQSVSLYVERFNEGGLDHLLDRRLPPGRVPFLTEEQQQEIRQLVLTTTLWMSDGAFLRHGTHVYYNLTFNRHMVFRCHGKVFGSYCIVFACHGHARPISSSKVIQCFKQPLKKNSSL